MDLTQLVDKNFAVRSVLKNSAFNTFFSWDVVQPVVVIKLGGNILEMGLKTLGPPSTRENTGITYVNQGKNLMNFERDLQKFSECAIPHQFLIIECESFFL